MLNRFSDLGAALTAGLSIGSAHILALTTDVPDIPTSPDEFIKWALKESALLAVIVIVLFFYRRDFKNKGTKDTAQLRESIQINTELRGQVARLARAIEEMNRRRRPGDPPFRDPEDSDRG